MKNEMSAAGTSTSRPSAGLGAMLVGYLPDYRPVLFATIAALLMSAAFIALRGWTWLDVLICLATAALSSIAVASYFQRKDAGYTARIGADAGSARAWRVEMNGVEIGRLSDQEFATMQLLVHRRGWNVIAQLLNAAWTAIASATEVLRVLLVAVPLTAFWSWVVIQVFVNPDATSQLLRYLQDGGAQQMPGMLVRLLPLVTAFTVLVCGFHVFLKGRLSALPGYRNHYVEDLHHRLRRHFKTAAMGNIVAIQDGHLAEVELEQDGSRPNDNNQLDVSAIASEVASTANTQLWRVMLNAFENVAFRRGLRLVRGGVAAPISVAVMAEIGQAVVVARRAYLTRSENPEQARKRLAWDIEDGTDIAYAEDIVSALVELDIAVCVSTTSSTQEERHDQ